MGAYNKAITDLSVRTGLSKATIKDLLKTGWTYREKINEPATFYAPFGSLKRNN